MIYVRPRPYVQIIHPHQAPPCDATRSTIYYSDEKGGDMPTCRRPATWRVGKHNFCKVHAGQAALHILMEETAHDQPVRPPEEK